MSAATGEQRTSATSRATRGTTPLVSDLRSTPASPRTPLGRSTSSFFGSPGGAFRAEDECTIFEIGARFLRGGVPGESSPRCTLSFGPDEQRRVGDYRQWDPEFAQQRRKRRRNAEWGQEYELYRPEVSQLDLGLVADQFERAVRTAYTKYFLLDNKPRRILLAMPPSMPHALISTMLDVLFTSVQAPTITLMSSPTLIAVAAGLRSALVVDIGWAETVVTAVYEYREVRESRSIRAGRLLSQEMARVLNAELDDDAEPGAPKADISFEETDEVLSRVAWCKPNPRSHRRTLYFPAREAPVLEEFEDAVESPPPTVTVPFPKNSPPTNLRIPFATLAKPADIALFGTETQTAEIDDHDLPLHDLVYRALVALPLDVRRVCMSRIIVTGGVSNLPGLKTRLQRELEVMVQSKGWSAVKSYGKASAWREEQLKKQEAKTELRLRFKQEYLEQLERQGRQIPPGLQDPEENDIDTKLANTTLREGPPPEASVGGSIRVVESLGAWAGASLVAQQKIKGVVEIERERYLQHGLQGASREKEVSVLAQRQSMGPGLAKGAGERASWTLGVWA